MHNVNKKQPQPCNVVVSGVAENSKMKECLSKVSSHSWPLHIIESDYHTYLQAGNSDHGIAAKKAEEIVYLTADSPNVIEELDESKVYIIGGIVDRNRYIKLTLNKAEKQGISHGKLPIGDHLKLKTSTVLTVNHVFEILAEQFNTKDWKKTLEKVIPDRKIISEKGKDEEVKE